MKIYIAGGLFKKGEIAERLREEEVLKSGLVHLEELEIYNPISAPVNDKSKLPTAKGIYELDIKNVDEADVIIVDLGSEFDAGVMYELGYAIAKGKIVIGHLYDLRLSSVHSYGNFHTLNDLKVDHNSNVFIPYGYNQFIIGAFESGVNENAHLVETIEEVVSKIKEIY